MIKIKLFGYKITIEKEGEKQKKAVQAKINTSLRKIEIGLQNIKKKNIKYSEYVLQKESNVSINTIKKYRNKIEEYKKQYDV